MCPQELAGQALHSDSTCQTSARLRPGQALGCEQLLTHHTGQGTQHPRATEMGRLASGCTLGTRCFHHPCWVRPNAGLQSSLPRVGANSIASKCRRRDKCDSRLPLLSPGSWGERSRQPRPSPGGPSTRPASPPSKGPRRQGRHLPSPKGAQETGPCHLPPPERYSRPVRVTSPRSEEGPRARPCPAPTAG